MKTILKNKYFWIAVVAGLIIGDIIGVALFRDRKEPVSESVISTVSAATTSPYFLRVSQQAATSTVLVSEVRTLATSTWLAVREQNGDFLGRILGARRVDATSTSEVVIDLLRPTTPHVMYAVVMYEDDGDRQFDFKLDTLVRQGSTTLSFPFTAF